MNVQTRDFERLSIGFYAFPNKGHPAPGSSRIWCQRCNFVFRATRSVRSAASDSRVDARDTLSGWMLQVQTSSGKSREIYIRNEECMSTSLLRRSLLSLIPGITCRIQHEAFWAFLEEDGAHKLPIAYVAGHCGKLLINGRTLWVCPGAVLENGEIVTDLDVFVTSETLRLSQSNIRLVVPPALPELIPRSPGDTHTLARLGKAISHFYGPMTGQALHVLALAVKSLSRSELLAQEHQVSVGNISGPPNVGKTLICSLGLAMIGCRELILSKVTPSAFLDHTHLFKDLLVVWDDPRDCPKSQLAALTHESFHGLYSSSLSKGHRAHNSSIIVGTQTLGMGLSPSPVNAPTLSRMSHVDMATNASYHSSRSDEERLQNVMEEGVNCFGTLSRIRLCTAEIGKLAARLTSGPDFANVIPRSIRTLATDWFFARELIRAGLGVDASVCKHYFLGQSALLQRLCSKERVLLSFVEDMLKVREQLSPQYFKASVRVNWSDGLSVDCWAFSPSHVVPDVASMCGKSYASTRVVCEAKNHPSFLINHNVSFSHEGETTVRRSIVVRKDVLPAIC